MKQLMHRPVLTLAFALALASAFHQGRRHPGRTPAEAALGTGGVLSRWAGSCPCP
jgi:hypothetical protein